MNPIRLTDKQERLKIYNHNNYIKNKIVILANVAKYKEEHKEELKQKAKKNRGKNKEIIKIRNHQHYLHNKEKRKEQRKHKKYDCFVHYSLYDYPQCSYPECNITDLDMLCIDHINNNGVEHRKEVNAYGSTFYEYLIRNNYPEGYQDLCANHNQKKEMERYCSIPASRESSRILRNMYKYKCLSHYSNGTMKCAQCGCDDVDMLVLDHINNGGRAHIREIGRNFYSKIVRYGFVPILQVLCANCNQKKEMERRRNSNESNQVDSQP